MPAETAPDPLPTRRRFLAKLSLALSGAIGAVATVPVIGFLLSPLTRRQPRVWRQVGRADAFRIGETVNVVFEDASPLPWAGVTARTALGSMCRISFARVSRRWCAPWAEA